MKPLSKSKLMALRQCPKRLWLEVHPPVQPGSKRVMRLEKKAQKLYYPQGLGAALAPHQEGWAQAIRRTQILLAGRAPIFEATLSTDGALAFADALLPVGSKRGKSWRMVEVKSATSVKPYHRNDIAVQAYVATRSGVDLKAVALAHIDSDWTYPGADDYKGLLIEVDLTDEAMSRGNEVQSWVDEGQAIIKKRKAPKQATGKQCFDPYECGFFSYCSSQEAQPQYPVFWLPRIQSKALKAHIEALNDLDLRHVPDHLLNDLQLRVKKQTLSKKIIF